MNDKGFGLIEGFIITVLLAFVGFGGYYVWNENQGDKNARTDTSKEHNQASDIDYSSWTKIEGVNNDLGTTASYKAKIGISSLRVYRNNAPRIYYSSNAPVYCQYDNNSWKEYSAIGVGGGNYKLDESSDACKKVDESFLKGLTTYARFGGALGQIRYIVAVKAGEVWLVFSESVNYDVNREINQEIQDSDFEKLNSDLKKRVEKRIVETIN